MSKKRKKHDDGLTDTPPETLDHKEKERERENRKNKNVQEMKQQSRL